MDLDALDIQNKMISQIFKQELFAIKALLIKSTYQLVKSQSNGLKFVLFFMQITMANFTF